MSEREAGRLVVLEERQRAGEGLEALLSRAGLGKVDACKTAADFLFVLTLSRPTVACAAFAADANGPDRVQEAMRTSPGTKLLILLDPATEWHAGAVDALLRAGAAGALLDEGLTTISLGGAMAALGLGHAIVPSAALSAWLGGAEAELPEALSRLSSREREVLGHVASGADNLSIGRALGISERTVRAHLQALYRKLGQGTRTQLAVAALKLGYAPQLRR